MSPPENPSEAAKYKHLLAPYLHGNVVDIGSGGWPVVPHAIQIEQEDEAFAHYTGGRKPAVPIQWRQNDGIVNLPFKDGTVDALFHSHILEDFTDWWPLLREWTRVIKPGGYMVGLIPDKHLWREALRKGQPPNCAHRHEGYVGELSEYARGLGLEVLEDRLTDCSHGVGNGGVQIRDYSILFVGRKPV